MTVATAIGLLDLLDYPSFLRDEGEALVKAISWTYIRSLERR